MGVMCAREKNLVYTLYIQSAENKEKNESLSKNKTSNLVQELIANLDLSFNLCDVSKTIDDTSITKKARGVKSRALHKH